MKRILIAPLDWGLGHASRCIPIIRYLLEKKCEVIIGADGRPAQLLQKEFPGLELASMPGYNISYPKNGPMMLKIASQIPKILSGIKREHGLLKKIIREKKIDAVISDSRFGLWSEEIFCVFITHQLMVKSPWGEKLIHKLNKNYISKYSECWVPDVPDSGLSGDLAHKFPLPKNTKYIGILSRFTPALALFSPGRGNGMKILVILSGPEPQRTVWEKKVLEQLASFPILFLKGKEVLIVRGITEKNEQKKISANVNMVSHLTSDELQREIIAADIVLSRPGYSTVMDLAVLQKKAIFVPTPGQTEQEYLAEYFSEKKIVYSISQKKFDLNIALEESGNYSGFTEKYSGMDFTTVVDTFLQKTNL